GHLGAPPGGLGQAERPSPRRPVGLAGQGRRRARRPPRLRQLPPRGPAGESPADDSRAGRGPPGGARPRGHLRAAPPDRRTRPLVRRGGRTALSPVPLLRRGAARGSSTGPDRRPPPAGSPAGGGRRRTAVPGDVRPR